MLRVMVMVMRRLHAHTGDIMVVEGGRHQGRRGNLISVIDTLYRQARTTFSS